MIRARLKSAVPLVDQVAEHIIGGGGKRLRPLLCVLAGRACGYRGERHIEAAAFIEFIHTATLLHDDVVDGSKKRRGRDTANEHLRQPGERAGRRFRLLARVPDDGHARLAARHGDHGRRDQRDRRRRSAAAHECARSRHHRSSATSKSSTARPAALFEAGAEVAAVLAGAAAQVQQAALARYGKHLGTAYQLVDDVLDYQSDPATRGKNLGDDLAEGKPTLPLIHALRHGNDEQRALIRQAIEEGNAERLEQITAAIESTGGLAYTARLARREAALAIEAIAILPDSAYKQALRELADFSVERTY